MVIRDIHQVFASAEAPVLAMACGGSVRPQEIHAAATKRARFCYDNEQAIASVLNSAGDNTIAPALKRDFVLQATCRDFARRVLPLGQFSTVFRDVPLEGSNKVEVPFYALDESASQSFVSGAGYADIGETNTQTREITVGQGATDGGRMYQALSFSSEEFRRLPVLNLIQLASLKSEKLAHDIVQDVLSIVTAAHYGASVLTLAADESTDSDAIAALVTTCKLWPITGRSLFLDTSLHSQMLKDAAFKQVFSAGSDAAIKEGRLYPRVFGFDYVENPTIPANGEKLVAFAAHKSAILVAFAPVPPIAEVRNAGTAYSMFIDPASGVVLETRAFGNNVLDRGTHVIESSYGFAVGNSGALKRIVSP